MSSTTPPRAAGDFNQGAQPEQASSPGSALAQFALQESGRDGGMVGNFGDIVAGMQQLISIMTGFSDEQVARREEERSRREEERKQKEERQKDELRQKIAEQEREQRLAEHQALIMAQLQNMAMALTNGSVGAATLAASGSLRTPGQLSSDAPAGQASAASAPSLGSVRRVPVVSVPADLSPSPRTAGSSPPLVREPPMNAPVTVPQQAGMPPLQQPMAAPWQALPEAPRVQHTAAAETLKAAAARRAEIEQERAAAGFEPLFAARAAAKPEVRVSVSSVSPESSAGGSGGSLPSAVGRASGQSGQGLLYQSLEGSGNWSRQGAFTVVPIFSNTELLTAAKTCSELAKHDSFFQGELRALATRLPPNGNVVAICNFLADVQDRAPNMCMGRWPHVPVLYLLLPSNIVDDMDAAGLLMVLHRNGQRVSLGQGALRLPMHHFVSIVMGNAMGHPQRQLQTGLVKLQSLRTETVLNAATRQDMLKAAQFLVKLADSRTYVVFQDETGHDVLAMCMEVDPGVSLSLLESFVDFLNPSLRTILKDFAARTLGSTDLKRMTVKQFKKMIGQCIAELERSYVHLKDLGALEEVDVSLRVAPPSPVRESRRVPTLADTIPQGLSLPHRPSVAAGALDHADESPWRGLSLADVRDELTRGDEPAVGAAAIGAWGAFGQAGSAFPRRGPAGGADTPWSPSPRGRSPSSPRDQQRRGSAGGSRRGSVDNGQCSYDNSHMLCFTYLKHGKCHKRDGTPYKHDYFEGLSKDKQVELFNATDCDKAPDKIATHLHYLIAGASTPASRS